MVSKQTDWECPICKTENKQPACTKCEFDCSKDYEHYASIAPVPTRDMFLFFTDDLRALFPNTMLEYDKQVLILQKEIEKLQLENDNLQRIGIKKQKSVNIEVSNNRSSLTMALIEKEKEDKEKGRIEASNNRSSLAMALAEKEKEDKEHQKIGKSNSLPVFRDHPENDPPASEQKTHWEKKILFLDRGSM